MVILNPDEHPASLSRCFACLCACFASYSVIYFAGEDRGASWPLGSLGLRPVGQLSKTPSMNTTPANTCFANNCNTVLNRTDSVLLILDADLLAAAREHTDDSTAERSCKWAVSVRDPAFLSAPVNPFHVLVYHRTCLCLLWNAKSSLGSRWSAPNKMTTLSLACKIIAHHIPFPRCLTHEVMTKLSPWENGCQVPLNSGAGSSRKAPRSRVNPPHAIVPVTWLPVCLCACMCVRNCCMPRHQCPCGGPTQWQPLGHPLTARYVCGRLCACATWAPPRDGSSPILPTHP